MFSSPKFSGRLGSSGRSSLRLGCLDTSCTNTASREAPHLSFIFCAASTSPYECVCVFLIFIYFLFLLFIFLLFLGFFGGGLLRTIKRDLSVITHKHKSRLWVAGCKLIKILEFLVSHCREIIREHAANK